MRNPRTKFLLSFVLVFALVLTLAPVAKADSWPGTPGEPEGEAIEVEEEEKLYHNSAFPEKPEDYEPFGEVKAPWEWTNWPGEFSADVYDEEPAAEVPEEPAEEEVEEPEKKNPPTGDLVVLTELAFTLAAAGYFELNKKNR